MKIGVFDSGKGGKSVAEAIARDMPHLDVVFRDDSVHLPYGSKSPDEIYGYVIPILNTLIEEGCAVIVIACNTVSTTLIERLRAELAVPLVAVEPMVKPAAEISQTGIFAVCATPTTLSSDRYAWLKSTYAHDIKVIEPDCSNWAAMIEDNALNREQISSQIETVIDQGADVIVLGCTHYHWIEQDIQEIAQNRAIVIQPEPAIIEQLKRVLAQLA